MSYGRTLHSITLTSICPSVKTIHLQITGTFKLKLISNIQVSRLLEHRKNQKRFLLHFVLSSRYQNLQGTFRVPTIMKFSEKLELKKFISYKILQSSNCYGTLDERVQLALGRFFHNVKNK